MLIIDTEKIPIKSWCKDLEPGALQQAKNLANLPFAFSHIALMPDTHVGFGMPIGGVLAAKGHVAPNAVGVDIGCGMIAVRTSDNSIPQKKLRNIHSAIKQNIPTGFKHNKIPCNQSDMPRERVTGEKDFPVVYSEYESARKQMGTLGGGNHFIEIQKGDDGKIWLMLHSGSRNLGKKVADYHNKVAKRLNEKSASPVPKNWDLASLRWDTDEGRVYVREMLYCLEFARLNRMKMLQVVQGIFTDFLPDIFFETPINIHHNYAALEEHFGKMVVVHRKGATSARKGQIGIIPGSQGSSSYIVVGKGNPDSFMSCSHGAGRKMGRKQAVRQLSLESEVRALERKGVLHAVYGKQSLDEAPSAYKDIDLVMKEQEDLVDIAVKLEPLAVVKG